MREITNTEITMTSLEIAERTCKEHRNVMRDIRDMLVELYGEGGLLKFEQTYKHPQNSQTYPMYRLPKKECLCLISGYSIPLRMAIVTRLEELESTPVVIPTTAQQFLALAQWQVDQEQKQAKIADRLLVVESQVKAIAEGENYFTIVGFCNITNRPVTTAEASRYGKQATAICRANGYIIGIAPHPVYGRINTYPRDILEEVIK